jgi:hypothetical protein
VGTARFTNPTLSRFELARPYNAFTGFNRNSLNLGSMTYDSLQFVANKRWAKGFTINVGYTWVPRWTEDGANTTTGIGNAYVDEVSLLKNSGPYFSHREHRITASGVWELPWYATTASPATCSAGRSRRRSSTGRGSPAMPATSMLLQRRSRQVAMRATRMNSSSTA